MSILLEKPENLCASIGCTNIIIQFGNKNKQRFCRKCLSGSLLEWSCKTCSTIISNSKYRLTKKYCDGCMGIPVKLGFS